MADKYEVGILYAVMNENHVYLFVLYSVSQKNWTATINMT